MERLNCKVVQDLLPSYEENLTAEGTSEEIKLHLAGCEECCQYYIHLQNKQEMEQRQQEEKGNRFLEKIAGCKYYFAGFLVGLVLPAVFILIKNIPMIVSAIIEML